MADNVPITAGAGTSIATDEIGGAHYQRIKLAHGADGSATDASEAAPLPTAVYGELVEAVQTLRMIAHAIDRSIGMAYADVEGRLRVTIAGTNTLTTVSTVSTVTACTTVSTLTNQTQVGGVNASAQIPALMAIAADNIRRNVAVTA